MSNRNLVFCGDIHGEWETFIWTALTRYRITNADIVILGDFGAGFDKALENNYKKAEHKLEEADVTVYVLRGNHDNPEYFIDENKYSFPRLRFMEDYKIYELCGKSILVIGGANSTDIVSRKENNAKWERKGSTKREWWEGEDIVRKEISELPKRVNIIASHDCPISFEPIATRLKDTPPEQFQKILDSRNYLEDVKGEVKSDYWFYGHYHSYYSGACGRLLYRCLGIMEFYELLDEEIYNEKG